MEKIQATVTVLTKNSGKTLQRALESVRDFDEVVVCDGASTDNTLEVARTYGAKIIGQNPAFLQDGKIFDFGGVRNQTLDAAKHNWIFWLDSDERAGSDLVDAIRTMIAERGEHGKGAFWVNRKYVLNNVVIDCASTYPNRQMRFFAKNSIEGMIKKVHEKIKLKPGESREFIGGYMYLPMDDDLLAVRRKWGYQIDVAVEQAMPITPSVFIKGFFHCSKVSLLWLFRLLRNSMFCSGTKMPLAFELERHYFHLRLVFAYWKKMKVWG
jgi:glycosyltransferase involved in cell wall biosynthesis